MALDTVVFDVKGKLFTIPVPNLRISLHPDALLSKAVLAARDNDGPIAIEGDPDLFPYMIEMHRLHACLGRQKCVIPDHISKAAVMQEARKFGLLSSAENIVEQSDQMRNDGLLSAGGEDIGKHFGSWSVDQVADWLKTLQAGRFASCAEKFRSEKVDGIALASLTSDRLRYLGMSDPRSRNAFMVAITQGGDACSAFTVDVGEEIERVTEIQKQRDASPECDHEERAKDSAALCLRSILGNNVSPEVFTNIIEEWRSQNTKVDERDHATKPSVNGIIVAARVRPVLAAGPDAAALDLGDFESITVSTEGVVVHACGVDRDGITPKVQHKSFGMHETFGQASTEADVSTVTSPLVDTAVKDRTHTTIICYGQTGSGKTHTIGYIAEHLAQHLFEHLGVQTVVLESFELKGASKGLVMRTSHAYSLHDDSKPELALFEGSDGACHVGGSNGVVGEQGQPLNTCHCGMASNSNDLALLFQQASQRRTSGETGRNAASSRSHAFYRFYIAERILEDKDGAVIGTGACIELVDLAGSESNKDALYHNKAQIDERAKINSSLAALNTCIQKQVQGASFVPFRQDKLTQLLRPCFAKRKSASNTAATVLFMACLSPLASDSNQSIRTLTYTQQLIGAPPKTTSVNKFMVEERKCLADAISSGSISELRNAIRRAQNNGVVGPERRKAMQALQALEAQQEANSL